MPNPFTAPLVAFASRLKHPTLFKLTVALMLVSWLWPFAGIRPWIMLDEPTIGQDFETREGLARLVATVCGQGYGAIFVTHDDAFADMLPHRRLHIENGVVSSPSRIAE